MVERPARRRGDVIERGKLAVVIGVESSNLFGCSRPAIHNARGRTSIAASRGPSASASAACSSPTGSTTRSRARRSRAATRASSSTSSTAGRPATTSHRRRARTEPGRGARPSPGRDDGPGPFFPATPAIAAEATPELPARPACNAKGLTKLGAYFVRRLIDNHMLIEVDHLSQRARERVLEIAANHDYPLVSSHTDTGGPGRRASCSRSTGSAGSPPRGPPRRRSWRRSSRPAPLPAAARTFAGVPLGTDTGGFAELPAPRPDAAAPARYPFRSYDGKVSFDRQRPASAPSTSTPTASPTTACSPT